MSECCCTRIAMRRPLTLRDRKLATAGLRTVKIEGVCVECGAEYWVTYAPDGEGAFEIDSEGLVVAKPPTAQPRNEDERSA